MTITVVKRGTRSEITNADELFDLIWPKPERKPTKTFKRKPRRVRSRQRF